MTHLDLLGIVLATLAALLLPTSRRGPLWPLRQAFRAVAARRKLAVGLVFATSFGLNALATRLNHPVPRVHDEFSYLLAADTFAHGRWTNPTHPLWPHFETFHVNQRPSYASKYPPGNGLILALGQCLTGDPTVGCWLGQALACAGLCWMLQAWMPARFALLGGLLAAMHVPMLHSWGQAYWGGGLTMFGGALMYGALRRCASGFTVGRSLTLGTGLFLLAITRPFEGLIAALPVACCLLVLLCRGQSGFKQAALQLLLPIGVVGLGIVGFVAYYNQQVTGNRWTLPYQAHAREYEMAPVFQFLPLQPAPEYRHATLAAFYTGFPVERYQSQLSVPGFVKSLLQKSIQLWLFFLSPVLSVPLVMLPRACRDGWTRFAAAALIWQLVALAAEVYLGEHYIAHATPLLFVLIVQSWRHLRVWRMGTRYAGRTLTTCLVLLCGFKLALDLAQTTPHPKDYAVHRAEIQARLESLPGQHLVIVRYGPGHNLHHEWVYNRAEIDAAKVVWARPMSRSRIQELLDYFGNRQLWAVDADAVPPRLVPLDRQPGIDD